MIKILLSSLLLLVTTTLLPLPAHALLQKGTPLPELSGETLDGEQFSIDSMTDRPFILKIGTTWCGTCGAQSKAIDELRDFMDENDIGFVEVFIQESGKKVRKYFDKKGYQLPDQVILDHGTISKLLNVYLIPRVLLIDKHHKIYRDGDAVGKSELKKELQKLVAAE